MYSAFSSFPRQSLTLSKQEGKPEEQLKSVEESKKKKKCKFTGKPTKPQSSSASMGGLGLAHWLRIEKMGARELCNTAGLAVTLQSVNCAMTAAAHIQSLLIDPGVIRCKVYFTRLATLIQKDEIQKPFLHIYSVHSENPQTSIYLYCFY